MKKIGIVFASSGGYKLMRTVRSFRRAEPDMPIHIVIDVNSKTFKENPEIPTEWLAERNALVRLFPNTAYINGVLNEGMRWMESLGYEYGCLFHDDIIFSPLLAHIGHVKDWFYRLTTDKNLQRASALTFSVMQAFVPVVWKRSHEDWDKMNLETEKLWNTLCPLGRPAGYYIGMVPQEITLEDFYVQFIGVKHARPHKRLGPTGQIVPIKIWNEIGGFDEKDGIFYDLHYPAECEKRGLPPIMIIPNIPHLHLHNQTIGFADPAVGLWSDTAGAFERRYGASPERFWEERGW